MTWRSQSFPLMAVRVWRDSICTIHKCSAQIRRLKPNSKLFQVDQMFWRLPPPLPNTSLSKHNVYFLSLSRLNDGLFDIWNNSWLIVLSVLKKGIPTVLFWEGSTFPKHSWKSVALSPFPDQELNLCCHMLMQRWGTVLVAALLGKVREGEGEK